MLAPQAFEPRAVSLAWSPATPAGGIEAAVVDVADGGEEAFSRAGGAAKGAWLLVHSRVIRTWPDLFEEYTRSGPIIALARKAGAAAWENYPLR